MELKPLEDRVVVKLDDEVGVTDGGIVLPDSAKKQSLKGTVIEIGPGRMLETGTRCEMTLSVGDRVLFADYYLTDIEVDDDKVKILREGEILAQIK